MLLNASDAPILFASNRNCLPVRQMQNMINVTSYKDSSLKAWYKGDLFSCTYVGVEVFFANFAFFDVFKLQTSGCVRHPK